MTLSGFVRSLVSASLLCAASIHAQQTPLINQPLVPDAASPGSPGFTLTVNGTEFVAGSTVNWNGVALATTFVSAHQLTAAVPAADVASPGTAAITVVNPGAANPVSNVVYFPVAASTTAVAFGGGTAAVGANPISVAAGDFNGDGKVDLAVANLNGGTVSILLGQGSSGVGDGTFAAQTTYPAGSNPSSIAIGDFNGDGILDLAVADFGSAMVSILLGQGDGTFVTQTTPYPTGTQPISIATGDFNGDGKLDLAVANNGSNTVSILLGQGDGTFVTQTTFPVGAGPVSIAIGDFNGDGKLDLAVANFSGATVSILLGQGDGTFLTQTTYPTGSGPRSIAIGDFNGDGKLDLAVANQGSSTVSILLGLGDGTFAAQTTYPTGSSPFSIAIGDFNGDGKLDLAAANFNSNTVSILLGQGDGTFAAQTTFPTGTNPFSIATADFNGDGKLDLAVANRNDNTVSILLQGADLTITKSHTGNFTQGQTGAQYTITVSNNGSKATDGTTVTVSDTLPAGLTATAISATGWICSLGLGTLTCTRGDALLPGGSYPPITLTVNVSGTAPASVTNTATVSGGGEVNTANDTANDLTIIGPPVADMVTNKSHSGNFFQGQTGAQYTITASNSGAGSTSGTVTVTDTLPSGLTATAISGAGWTCTLGTLTCTNSSVLGPGLTYPAITLTVNVAGNAPSLVTNTSTVSGGGETNTSNDTSNNSTIITQEPDLTISKTHIGNFFQGQTGAQYTISASNGGTVSTSGTVTVTDTLPSGLTATAISGTGWTCTLGTLTCTRNDALATLSSYPAITLTVNVAGNAPALVTNTATVSGGGEVNTANDTSNNSTIITQEPDLTISKSHTGNFFQGQTGAQYTITVSNSGSAPTSGTVTVTDTLPAGLTATAISGTGWTCTLGTLTCTRSDNLAAGEGGSYPAITLTVTVAGNAPASVTNTATVSGGGEVNTANDTASDPTTIAIPTPLINQPLVPAAASPGSGAFALTVNGTEFVSGSKVNWNGVPLVTTFVSAHRLTAAVPSANVASAGTASVTVVNSGAANPISNVVYFPVAALTTGVGFGGGTAATGTHPAFVAAGDFNGDSKVDLAVANQGSNTVSILLGQGGGTFVTQTTYSTGSLPTSIATGDFNGDGILDLAVANQGSNTVSILLGQGNGTFVTQPATYPTGGSPLSIATGDFNGDGKLDLVVANLHSTTVSILLGQGDGTFAPQTTYATGNAPASVALGDFNGDGKLDLAVTNQNDGTVSILLGQGDGAFAPQTTYPGGGFPSSVAVGDFNGDGKLDLAVANLTDNTVSILLGQGNGAFAPQTTYPTGNAPSSIALGDFNGDGKLDLAVTNQNDGTLSILLGQGNGTFAPQTMSATGNAPGSIAIGDFNGDGKLDLAVANFNGDTVSILLQGADLAITKSHTGNFTQGETGATYTIAVSNSGSLSTSGTVTVTDTLPAGLTATAISGTGWTCTLGTLTCTRSDALAPGASYPAITLTVNVAGNAPASVTNTATVSGGGEVNTANDTASDPTTITQEPDLTISKSHTGNFFQSQTGAQYTITASNIGSASTSGTVTVTDTLPSGLTATALTGTGWTCTLGTLTCTRIDALVSGGSYPAITLTVNVAGNAPSIVTNTATVSGGGETNTSNDTSNNTTLITQEPDLTISKTHTGNFFQGQTGAQYTITVSNSGSVSTTGTVTVTDTLPSGLTATAISGTGWTCTLGTLTCTRSDALATVSSYPAITLTVNVAGNAPASVTNTAAVSGGGEVNTANDTANDSTIIGPPPTPTPLINQPLVPDAASPGSAGFTLTVNGTEFVSGSKVNWNGGALVTTFVNAHQLTAAVPAANVASAGTAAVTVVNAGAANPISNVVYFPIAAPSTGVAFGGGTAGTDTNPVFVAAGDFNSDGKVDLAVANLNGGTVSILLGQGSGAFAAQATYPTGTNPVAIAIGDFNGDGKLDLAVANQNNATVSILLGQGDGTFAAQTTYSTGFNPQSVAIGDFNGDGKLDLAVANFNSNTVSILLGRGDGTFAAQTTYPTGTNPIAIAIGDFNGDGKLDLAVPNFNSNTVSILLGQGDGTFAAQTTYPTAGSQPISIAIGDFNGDGKLDLAVANQNGNTVSILLGQGDGTFVTQTTTYPTGTNPNSIAIGDFNGDGKLDLAVANFTDNTVSILLGQGDGTFAAQTTYPTGAQPVSIAIGDFNGDGKLDLAVANVNGNTVSILLQGADLTITKSHTGNFTQGQTGATYTITGSNNGSLSTSGTVTVTDTLPAGLTATAISGTGWTCTLGTLTCTRGDALAPGGSYPAITLTVNVAGNAPASVTNTAAVSGGGEVNTANDTASDPTTINAAVPDLTITKSHTGSFFQGQSGATYTITVSNIGSGSTSGTVTVSDTLPTGLTATAISGTGWTCTLGTLTCTRSDALASAASYPAITLTVTVAGNAPASVTNSANVSGGGEVNTANDTASDPTTVTQEPDLTISKSHAGNFAQGQTGATYTITVGNNGSASTSGTVTVSDTLPAGLTATAISGTGWTCTLGTLTCTRSDALASAASYPAITLTVTVAGNAPASVTNTATVSGGGEVNTANDTAGDPTTITQEPDLTISKSHAGNFAQGQTGATYTITVSNIGSASTSGAVTVSDTLPAGLTATAISGTGWICTLGTLTCTRSDALASAASYPAITLTVSVAGNAPASVTNTATVSGGGEVNTANDTASDSTTTTQEPDLTISKSHAGNFFQGQTGAQYTIAVTNTGAGAVAAGNPVTVTDTLPAGLTATAISGTGWTCTLGTLTCTRGDALAAAASYPSITLTVNVAGNAPASVTNTATVSGGGDINPANNTAGDPTTITQEPDLTISKSHTGNFFQSQTGATYTITVSNNGSASTSGTVTVSDTLPAGLTATAISGTGWTCTLGTLTCTRSDALAPAASYPAITLTVNVAGNAPASVTNTATVSGGGEVNTANDTANDPTTLGSPNPTPLINQPLVPDAASPGSGAFTLTVNGTEFVSGSTVNWNGVPLVTTFVSVHQLTAAVPAANIASAGTAAVTVVNAGAANPISNVVYFPIAAPSTGVAFGGGTAGVGTNPYFVAAGDFNGDGKLDLAVANLNGATVSILLGQGDGTFAAQTTYPTGSNPQSIAIGDFNGDGRLDLAVANVSSSTVSILLGQGDGTFATQTTYPTGSGPISIAIGDFNGDGKLDLAVANFGIATRYRSCWARAMARLPPRPHTPRELPPSRLP